MSQDLISLILLGVFLFCSIGVILIGAWFYRNQIHSQKLERISRYIGSSLDDNQLLANQENLLFSYQEFGRFRGWINETLTSLSSERLKVKLSGAFWPITDTEYILMRIVITFLALSLGWLLTGNIFGGIVLAVIAFMVPPILLDRTTYQRQHKFHNQLLDVLTLIKGAVQAGYGLMQALDLAVNEIPAPASEEFGRVLREIRLGYSLETALFNLAERMSSDDLQIVVTAILINSQVGGNLSTILEATISTIRDRMNLVSEIRSISSYARYVGNFMSLIPFILGFGVFLLSPEYFDTLKTSLFTQIIFLMAFVGIIIGNTWIRQIVKVKV